MQGWVDLVGWLWWHNRPQTVTIPVLTGPDVRQLRSHAERRQPLYATPPTDTAILHAHHAKSYKSSKPPVSHYYKCGVISCSNSKIISHVILVLLSKVFILCCCSSRLQCRIDVGAIDAAALGQFKKQAHGHGRGKEKSSLFWLWFLCLVQFPENH